MAMSSAACAIPTLDEAETTQRIRESCRSHISKRKGLTSQFEIFLVFPLAALAFSTDFTACSNSIDSNLGIVQDAKSYPRFGSLNGTYPHDLMGKLRNRAVTIVVLIGSLPFAINHSRLNSKHLIRSKCARC